MWILFQSCFRDDDYPISTTYTITVFTDRHQAVEAILDATGFYDEEATPEFIDYVKQYLHEDGPLWQGEWKRRGSGDYY
jgi:hypothetical protein